MDAEGDLGGPADDVGRAGVRLFVGIPLAAATEAALVALTARVHRAEDGLRWTAPAQWHITLQFLGETTRERMEAVAERFAEVRAAEVGIELEEPGCFERAGVFHVGVRATAGLAELERRVTAATGLCGFKRETRAWRPHITLARERVRGAALAGLRGRLGAPERLPGFTAREFLLYESFLEARGARYEVRGRVGLGNG